MLSSKNLGKSIDERFPVTLEMGKPIKPFGPFVEMTELFGVEVQYPDMVSDPDTEKELSVCLLLVDEVLKVGREVVVDQFKDAATVTLRDVVIIKTVTISIIIIMHLAVTKIVPKAETLKFTQIVVLQSSTGETVRCNSESNGLQLRKPRQGVLNLAGFTVFVPDVS